MKTFFRRSDIVLLFAGIAAFYYFAATYDSTYPEAAIRGMVTKDEAQKYAEQFMRSGQLLTPVSMDSFRMHMRLRADQKQIQYLQESLGLEEANRIMAGGMNAYVWQITWEKISEENIRLRNGGDDDKGPPDRSNREIVEMSLDHTGRPVRYSCQLKSSDSVVVIQSDKTDLPPIPPPPTAPVLGAADSAQKIADEFLKSTAGLLLDDFHRNPFQTSIKNNRTSFDFSYLSLIKKHEQVQQIRIRVEEGKISYFETSYQFPSEFIPHKDRWLASLLDTIDVFVILLFAIVTAVYFFIRFKKGAFDFKLGLFFGSIVGLTFAVMMAVSMDLERWAIMALILVFAGGWYFLISTIIVSVSASVSHQAWPAKYQTFEALRRGRVWNQNFGFSLLRGILWSGILLGVSSILLQQLPGTAFLLNQQSFQKFGQHTSLFLICASVWSAIIYFHCFYLLTLSAIRMRIKATWFIFAAGILIGFIYPYIFTVVSPPLTRVLIGAGIGMFFTFLLFRYDFLTLIITGALTYLIQESFYLFGFGDMTQVSILLFFLVLLVIVALIGIFSRETGEDLLEFVPEYVKELENKQRMNREFEIARQIQSTLLCRNTPETEGFEIASLCNPAFEAGGDYYDFIQFPGHSRKVGVIIGDVSGKGVSAAFYMTLAKGIMQTQASITPHSTKDTLCRANDIFYDQIDRGKFISMIYAIFDHDKQTMIMSRAGHNPVLIKKSGTGPETLTPSGIAIGLTKGKAFSDSLEEIEVPFKPGDTFVFYTDGFSEAMNKHNTEFGEQRLSDIIHRESGSDAQRILEAVTRDISSFVGSVPQHDDMTMIVVKIR